MGTASNSGRDRSGRVRTSRITAGPGAIDDGSCEHFDESWVVIYATVPRLVCERFELSTERASYLVGRSRQCDIVVDSVAVSRQHARIERDGDSWAVCDLESTNGVYVDDARVTKHVLVHGDRVQIGDTFFKHLAGDGADAAYLDALRTALVTDGLTQASNDRAFRAALDRAVEDALEERRALSLVMLDVDWFKRINDAHGHPAGDRVLRELARVLRAALPAGAVLGRVGGEEFAVVLPGCDLDAALAIAEGARAAVAAHAFISPAGVLRVTASFGVAECAAGQDTPTGLFACADQQLYAAKRDGRNAVKGRA